MLPKIAAITMVYNEAVWLPVWARHYTRQVGADQCYVLDHGSTEPLATPPGMNVVRLPRSPHDDSRRAQFVSKFAASLLDYYDWVIYTDVDELVLADPRYHANLPAFCSTATTDTISAIGLDVQHVPPLEPRLDPALPVGAQRGWVRFTSAMCKPVLTRTRLAWAPGFHSSDQPLGFASLYLFHLHWADHDLGLQRLAKTRSMPWANVSYGAHQRVSDNEWSTMFKGMSQLPRLPSAEFDPSTPPIRTWLDRTVASSKGRGGQTYAFDLHLNAAELWPIPSCFRAKL